MNVIDQLRVIQRERNQFRHVLGETIDANWPREVKRVANCFSAHLCDPDFLVEDACQRCGVSSGRFRLIFKRTCLKTMHEYRTEKRMLLALRLIAIEGLDLGNIAFEIGYTNYRTFGRAFKRYFCCNPSELREEIDDYIREPDSLPPGMDLREFRCLTQPTE